MSQIFLIIFFALLNSSGRPILRSVVVDMYRSVDGWCCVAQEEGESYRVEIN